MKKLEWIDLDLFQLYRWHKSALIRVRESGPRRGVRIQWASSILPPPRPNLPILITVFIAVLTCPVNTPSLLSSTSMIVLSAPAIGMCRKSLATQPVHTSFLPMQGTLLMCPDLLSVLMYGYTDGSPLQIPEWLLQEFHVLNTLRTKLNLPHFKDKGQTSVI